MEAGTEGDMGWGRRAPHASRHYRSCHSQAGVNDGDTSATHRQRPDRQLSFKKSEEKIGVSVKFQRYGRPDWTLGPVHGKMPLVRLEGKGSAGGVASTQPEALCGRRYDHLWNG